MPQASPDCPAVVRFGPFALDLRSGELSRDGARTRLQDQPFAFLRCLLEHPGRLVTRDELRRRLWPQRHDCRLRARHSTPPPHPVVTHINLIQNWFEELKAKVPVR